MARQIAVTIEKEEFEQQFPEIAKLKMSESDKVRVALGLSPRKAKAGAPKDNKNAIGNKGRWTNEVK